MNDQSLEHPNVQSSRDYSITPEHVLHNPTREPIVVGDVAYVRLTQGKWALIDAIDTGLVGSYGKWSAVHNPHGKENWYSWHNISANGKQKHVSMHTLIYETAYGSLPVGHTVDHIHGTLLSPDLLDNRRSNLRPADRRLQGINTHIRRNGKDPERHTSRYIGVTWQHSTQKWVSNIVIQSKIYYLGFHDSEEDAATCYLMALGEWERYMVYPDEYLDPVLLAMVMPPPLETDITRDDIPKEPTNGYQEVYE
jgi:hypothetical protein